MEDTMAMACVVLMTFFVGWLWESRVYDGDGK